MFSENKSKYHIQFCSLGNFILFLYFLLENKAYILIKERFYCSLEETVIIKDAHYIANIHWSLWSLITVSKHFGCCILKKKTTTHTHTHTCTYIHVSHRFCRAELWSPLLKMQHSTAFFNVSLFCHKEWCRQYFRQWQVWSERCIIQSLHPHPIFPSAPTTPAGPGQSIQTCRGILARKWLGVMGKKSKLMISDCSNIPCWNQNLQLRLHYCFLFWKQFSASHTSGHNVFLTVDQSTARVSVIFTA